MSMMPTPGMSSQRHSIADNDVYTVLMLVAFLFMLTAVIYVAYQSSMLFGGPLPPGGG